MVPPFPTPFSTPFRSLRTTLHSTTTSHQSPTPCPVTTRTSTCTGAVLFLRTRTFLTRAHTRLPRRRRTSYVCHAHRQISHISYPISHDQNTTCPPHFTHPHPHPASCSSQRRDNRTNLIILNALRNRRSELKPRSPTNAVVIRLAQRKKHGPVVWYSTQACHHPS